MITKAVRTVRAIPLYIEHRSTAGPGRAWSYLRLGRHALEQVTGSPVVGGHTVYSLTPRGALYALDMDTGMARATVAVGATSRFATLAGGHVFEGT